MFDVYCIYVADKSLQQQENILILQDYQFNSSLLLDLLVNEISLHVMLADETIHMQ